MTADGHRSDGPKLVTFDLDGTLTTVHGWWVIAQARHREVEYRASNERFFRHEIGEDEHLADLLELAVGLTRAEVGTLLEGTPRVEGIDAALNDLRARGARVALLTHNPDYVCDWYRERFGFDAAEGTDGTVFDAEGRIVGIGSARADKPAGLARLLARFDIAPSSAVHVGDGWADAAVFAHVGGGVAFNSRLPEVERAADAVVRSRNLEDVVRAIDRLSLRSVVNDGGRAGQGSNT